MGRLSQLEVYDLFTNIYDILYKAVSKWAGNTACTLPFLFNSASGQCCDVWKGFVVLFLGTI